MKKYICVILCLLLVSILTGCTENKVEDEKKDTTETYKYLFALYASTPKKETIYGGTVTTRFGFQKDGTVLWGQCYTATGKCAGNYTYTYELDGLDVTIYQDNGDVQYYCYLTSSQDTIYCRHHKDAKHIAYYKMD